MNLINIKIYYFGREINEIDQSILKYDVLFDATLLNRENYCYYLFLTQHLNDG